MQPPLDMGKTSGIWMMCSLAEVAPTASDTLAGKKMDGKKWGTLTSSFCHTSFCLPSLFTMLRLKKQVFTPFSMVPPWLRMALNPSPSLLPFKLNSHLKSSLEARGILRSSN
jgi:hypothetical protein